MNKEKYIELVNQYFKYHKKVKEIFLDQINIYFNAKNNNKIEYKVGDIVNVTPNTLIHGTRLKINELDKIKTTGLIASEFYKEKENKKKPFVIEFFNVNQNLTLKEYIDKYVNGCTVTLHDMKGIPTNTMINYKEIFHYIKNQNFRDYSIYQNQEQRFLPNDFRDKVDIAFILTYDKNNPVYKYDVFDKNFDKKILKAIFPKWFYKKYLRTRKWDNHETGREKAFIFGIPSRMIEGIIISRKYEQDNKIINNIKEKFPDCYICNLDGKVIAN